MEQQIYTSTRNKHSLHNLPIRPLGPFPQDILLDLPRARLGQLRNHLDLARDHELADTADVPGPLDDVLALDSATGFDGDERFGSFAPLLVGDGHHAGFEDVGMRDQHGLQR